MQPVLFDDDRQFWFETLRTMGHAAYGGADIGEILTTAQNLMANDPTVRWAITNGMYVMGVDSPRAFAAC